MRHLKVILQHCDLSLSLSHHPAHQKTIKKSVIDNGQRNSIKRRVKLPLCNNLSFIFISMKRVGHHREQSFAGLLFFLQFHTSAWCHFLLNSLYDAYRRGHQLFLPSSIELWQQRRLAYEYYKCLRGWTLFNCLYLMH